MESKLNFKFLFFQVGEPRLLDNPFCNPNDTANTWELVSICHIEFPLLIGILIPLFFFHKPADASQSYIPAVSSPKFIDFMYGEFTNSPNTILCVEFSNPPLRWKVLKSKDIKILRIPKVICDFSCYWISRF